MLAARRCLRPAVLNHALCYPKPPHSRWYSSKPSPTICETDSLGIPLQPTWSVHDLLSSYPTPTITPATFKRLHELSALIPPAEGTVEHDSLKRELEELIKLVEAVKLVQLDDEGGVPDGRIWAQGTGLQFVDHDEHEDGESGRALLRHAARTEEGLYLVDADKRK